MFTCEKKLVQPKLDFYNADKYVSLTKSKLLKDELTHSGNVAGSWMTLYASIQSNRLKLAKDRNCFI